MPLSEMRGITRNPVILAAAQFAVVAIFTVLAPADLQLGYRPCDRPNVDQALREWRPLAENGDRDAQFCLGLLFAHGLPTSGGPPYRYERDGKTYFANTPPSNHPEALRWYRRSAVQGHPGAQNQLGIVYQRGYGASPDVLLSYFWHTLAATEVWEGRARAIESAETVGRTLTPSQLATAQRMVREWAPRPEPLAQSKPPVASRQPTPPPATETPIGTGSGFVVTRRGEIVTNQHVVDGCREVRAGMPHDMTPASVVFADARNDLALLRVPQAAQFWATFRTGRGIRPGDAVIAIGFPLRGLLASAANVTTGTVSALAGLRDDVRFLQITAPVQPGNSGGPLLDQSGNVIGLVVGKLDAVRIAKITGDIPQNVNFAIHGTLVQTLLENNGIAPDTLNSGTTLTAADVAERARKFTVLIECWK